MMACCFPQRSITRYSKRDRPPVPRLDRHGVLPRDTRPAPEADAPSSLAPRACQRMCQPNCCLSRPFATDLRQVLVYDHTQWSASVPRDHLSGWRVTEDELFALGMAHVRSQSIRLVPLQIPSAPRLVGWVEKNLLIADHFLRLHELGKWPRLGALVAVPTRGALLVQPIYGRAIYDEGRMLVTLAIVLHSRDPWPLSPRLYWWREGRIRDVNVGVEGGRLQLIFPEQFA